MGDPGLILFPACPECWHPSLACVCPPGSRRRLERWPVRETMKRLGELNGGQMPITISREQMERLRANPPYPEFEADMQMIHADRTRSVSGP